MKKDQVLETIRSQGVIRAKELKLLGIHQESLKRLLSQGLLVRSGRGVYTLPDIDLTENQSLIEACVRVPHGIVCLLSALRFHELTTQAPYEVWLAIANSARCPKEDILALRIVRMSGDAMSAGLEEHYITGQKVRVYNIPKTVADCFKFRYKIGLDVAIEALKESLFSRRTSIDELWHYAKICRVANVMRPYLESIV